MLREAVENAEKKFLNDFIDFASDRLKEFGYYDQKVSKKDFIGNVVTALRKENSKLYNYWAKNRSKELYDKIAEL